MPPAALNHVAIIPDGNRRWAREHRLPTIEGHRRGFEAVRKAGDWLRAHGVHTLTVWGFSTENWTREREEVRYLMDIYGYWIRVNLKTAIKDNMRIIHLGRKDRLPQKLLKSLQEAETKTASFTKYTLGIALDYGGRDEIIRAIKAVRGTENAEISEADFGRFLDTKDFQYPDPDLVIRTSGEMRTSGFLTWQAAYAEYIFIPKYLPDITEEDMKESVAEFHNRQRRYGA